MRTSRNETLKRDNLIVDYLLNNKGSENVKTRHEIADFLTQNGFATNPKAINMILHKVIRERHLPICSLNSKGYYWAKNKQDILNCLKHLKSRVESINEHIELLESFIIE